MKNSLLLLFLLLGTTLSAQVNQKDAKGRKQGPWQVKYDGSAVLKYKGQFKDDKPVGTFTYYYESNKVKAVIKHDASSTRSVAYYYHENGSLMSHGIFLGEKKDSTWVTFGPSERLSSVEKYVNGELHGEKVVYFIPEDPSNKAQVPSAVYHYNHGLLDGEFKEYHVNGKTKATGQYVKGKKVGVWNYYHISGRQSHLYRYKNGVKHGWSYSYDQSGKEEFKAYFYYGRHLEGKQLEEKLRQLKQLGINPNE